MLEDKITDDQVICLVFAGPFLGEVCHGEFDIASSHLFACIRDHPLGKIESMDLLSNLREEYRVLPGSAADLDDRLELQVGKRLPQHVMVEIARQVLITVVGSGPIVICVLDTHVSLAN